MKKKFLGIGICLLFLLPLVPLTTSVTIPSIITTPPNLFFPPLVTQTLKNTINRYPKNIFNPVTTTHPRASSPILDHWEQQAKLLASDGSSEDFFTSLGLSISGDTAVIGAWGDDDLGEDSGSAYVFTRTGTTWTQQAKLLASDGQPGDAFGWCVKIKGDTILIGAAGDDMLKGSVYIFTRTGTTWTEDAKLVTSDGAPDDQFGYCIDISEDTAIIGANCDDDNGFDSGSAYVFTCSDSTWTQQAKILPADGAPQDSFGGEVAISGDTILIGSCFDDDNGFDSGSAYVFHRTDTTWTQQAKLLATDGAPSDYFSAYAVSLSQDTALIGSQCDDDNGTDSGSAYLFTRTGTTWTQHSKLHASDAAAQDYFGGSVALVNTTILISAGGNDDHGADSGSAYVFTQTNTTWTQEAKILATDGQPGDVFGWNVALDNNTALIGAYYDDDNGIDSGSAYIFIKAPDNQPPTADFTWIPQTPIINQNITLDASLSQDPDGTIILYEWDWNNDGIYDEAQSDPTTTHQWTNNGSYPVTLRVTDNTNVTATITKTIQVTPIPFNITINGGLGVHIIITNAGATNATNVPCIIHITGGLLKMINTTIEKTLIIQSGHSVPLKTPILFGVGPLIITVHVIENEYTATGIQFLILSIIK
jgi:hypothetical protein